MAMVVKNNMSAINTLNTLNTNSSALSKSLAKVSSGMKINGAADDASGYAISERMRVQIRGLDQANANTQNGSSMMKTAEGAVSSTVDILKTLKEKVISAANDDKTDADRQAIQKELDQSIDQINDNANITYNGKYLVDGSHNNKIDTATTTSFTNQSLNESTKGSTQFTAMTDRNGNSLNIQSDDTVSISFVKQGKTYTTSLQASGANMQSLIQEANLASFKQQLIEKGYDFSNSTVKSDWASLTTAYKSNVSAYVAELNKADTQATPTGKISAINNAISTKKESAMSATFGTLTLKASIDYNIGNDTIIGKDTAGDTVYTADRSNGITVRAATTGVSAQVSGITLSVSNTKGAVQKSVNAALDNFSETIRAQNVSKDNAITLQVGTKANQSIRVGLTDMRAEALGLQSSNGETLNVSTQKNANAAINVLDNAIQKALDQQTTIGAIESRLEYTSTNLTTSSQNVQASESTIRDADMAKEMTNYTRNNVLLQAAQSMLAQANQSSSSVLSLLQ
ncbi:flagellin [Selenomonas sp. AB3002]|uniref:flagellin N-terminal helical domain-containing protein n=1 Tax=Selenomonas sp. AB3002 TaxID=1392502 RepID=UPI000495F419